MKHEMTSDLVNQTLKIAISSAQKPQAFNAEQINRDAAWLGLNTFGDPELIKLVEGSMRWARGCKAGNSPRWLVLLGNNGTGKTAVAHKLWNWIKSWPPTINHQGHYCQPHTGLNMNPRFIHWPRFAKEELQCQEYGTYNEMMRWPFLILDEVGGERDSTGHVTECLSTLLNARVRHWTIITSNKTLAEMESIDRRISSRILRDDSVIIDVKAMDYSVRMAIMKKKEPHAMNKFLASGQE